ncbi:hypothetical protein WH50_02570 [Pokkaliibacter plantistimulans]|uniref:Gluconokinase n=2 Tax=Pokkaliibacter plantistimulans TaxID=1635171 RepID=A0ABX5M1K3_9GAMM|nr:gluconokinase [Pokkaliibacter plantistimulans]PXF32769.1 hypothetical protein WH50_02570 [Pokkaliibacter plantistimulans]
MKHPVIVVMGVSGCGKSLIGQRLADRLGLSFVEGDAYHPQCNVDKMSQGIPLTDEDRRDWLALLADKLAAADSQGTGLVLSCSSLKGIYRDQLRSGCASLQFVYLQGSYSTIKQRMAARQGHFMPTSLLDSQFGTLEEPLEEPGVAVCDVRQSPDDLVSDAMAKLSL